MPQISQIKLFKIVPIKICGIIFLLSDTNRNNAPLHCSGLQNLFRLKYLPSDQCSQKRKKSVGNDIDKNGK